MRKSNPINSRAKPIAVSPQTLYFLFDLKNNGTANAKIGSVNELNLNKNPPKDTIHAVIVVPMLAPIMSPTDCRTEIIPALTKHIIITVDADDVWIKEVNSVPKAMPLKLLRVSRLNKERSCAPEALWMPSLSTFIPYMNSASDPVTCKMTIKLLQLTA